MKYILTIIAFLLLISISSGAPTLDSYSNNVSNDLYPRIAVDGSVLYNVSITNTSSLTYYWILDGVDQSNQAESISITYTTTGNKYLSFHASNGTANTTTITWNTIVTRKMATGADIKATYSEEPIDTIQDSLSGDAPDVRDFFYGTSLPYINVMGNFFFLILYFLPMLSIWISQRNLLIPVGLSVIFQAVLIGALPEEFRGPAFIIILITLSGILWKLTKGYRN